MKSQKYNSKFKNVISNGSEKSLKLKRFLAALGMTMGALLLVVNIARAENMNSERYKLQFGTIDIGGGTVNSQNYNVSTSLGQTAAQKFDSAGYVVKAGFQYVRSIIPFRFAITDTSIDLGTLKPNTFSNATTDLIVSFGGAGQYEVTAAENGPLQTLSLSTIPDTTCNGGTSTCTETLAQAWTSTSTYGFGYSMSGQDVPADFSNETSYRPFPDESHHEQPAVVMTSPNFGINRRSTVNFRANIGPSQTTGSYQTVIKFTAIPSF